MTTAIQKLDTNIEDLEEQATRISKSMLIPQALRGKPADVLIILMTGAELGLTPMQSIRGFDVINGVPSMKSELMVALVKRHPDCVKFKLVSSDDTKASYVAERKGEGETSLDYTIQQAAKAGLVHKDNWKAHPADMLRARCAKKLAKVVFPEITFGLTDEDFAEPNEEKELNAPPHKTEDERARGPVVQDLKAALMAKAAEVRTAPPVVAEPSSSAPVEGFEPMVTSPTPEPTPTSKPVAKVTIIDQAADESEEEAMARAALTPYKKLVELGHLFNKTEKEIVTFARTVTSKTLRAKADVTDADVRAVQDAIDALHPPRPSSEGGAR